MTVKTVAFALGIVALVAAYALNSGLLQTKSMEKTNKVEIPKDAQSLYVAGGCFWCLEAQFEDLEGVYAVESGYAGGDVENPTYEQVCTGTTGHAEVVRIFFDEKKITAEDLLRIFFAAHDPTTLNRQGPDTGTQYRSAVFYTNDAEKKRAEDVRTEVEQSKIWSHPIVTSIEPLKNYTRAEEYHQDYFNKFLNATPEEQARMNRGYCVAVVEPKVAKFREKYRSKLKKKSETLSSH